MKYLIGIYKICLIYAVLFSWIVFISGIDSITELGFWITLGFLLLNISLTYIACFSLSSEDFMKYSGANFINKCLGIEDDDKDED